MASNPPPYTPPGSHRSERRRREDEQEGPRTGALYWEISAWQELTTIQAKQNYYFDQIQYLDAWEDHEEIARMNK